jgi:hypothetical protein
MRSSRRLAAARSSTSRRSRASPGKTVSIQPSGSSVSAVGGVAAGSGKPAAIRWLIAGADMASRLARVLGRGLERPGNSAKPAATAHARRLSAKNLKFPQFQRYSRRHGCGL